MNPQRQPYSSFPIVGVPIRNISDYSPFGVQLDGRTVSLDNYRYGFQNQEEDSETGLVNYKYRMHDPRVGRFFAVDPLTKKYPYLTPYQFSSNQPIHAPELEGLESARELGWAAANPIDAMYVNANKGHAETWSSKSKLTFPRDGEFDAYRHAFWNALNAIDIGSAEAKVIGDLHEAANNPNDDPVAVKMDLHNNKIGRQIARDYLKEIGGEDNLPSNKILFKAIDKKVKQAIKDGKMLKIKMDTDGNYLDSDGYRIDTTKDGWEKSKVTVKSNWKEKDATKTKFRTTKKGDSKKVGDH